MICKFPTEMLIIHNDETWCAYMSAQLNLLNEFHCYVIMVLISFIPAFYDSVTLLIMALDGGHFGSFSFTLHPPQE